MEQGEHEYIQTRSNNARYLVSNRSLQMILFLMLKFIVLFGWQLVMQMKMVIGCGVISGEITIFWLRVTV